MESTDPVFENREQGKSIGRKKPTPEQRAAARAKRIETQQKHIRALELRKAGHDFQTIATTLKYANPSGAYKAVKSVLQKAIQEPADELIALEVARLDHMLRGIWSKVINGDLGAIDRGLRIMERRAKLLGLDRPMKFDVRSMVDDIAKEFGLDADEKAAVHTDVERFLTAANAES